MIKVKIRFHKCNREIVSARLRSFTIHHNRLIKNSNDVSIEFTGNILQVLQQMNRIGSGRVSVNVVSYQVTPY